MIMKKVEEIKPNYAPVYAAALYPELAKIFQKHGYALAVHGSLARDFDLIAVPWIDNPSKQEDVIKEITETFAIKQVGEPYGRPPARMAYTLSIGHGDCSMDLSFFPFYETITEESK